ncbi:MAG: hypothetical protein ACYTFK_14505 [Planctomycetota bacterium]|jgi:hypothetical protein
MPAKTKLKVASCPLGKWQATISKTDIEEIRKFLTLSDKDKQAEQLTNLASRFLHPSKRASSCSSCNRKIITDLQKLVQNADSET